MNPTIELKEKFTKIFKEATNTKSNEPIEKMFHLIQEIAQNTETNSLREESPSANPEVQLVEKAWKSFFEYQEDFDKKEKNQRLLVRKFGEKIFKLLLELRFINEDGSYAKMEPVDSPVIHVFLSALYLKKSGDFFDYGNSVLNDLYLIYQNMEESEDYVMEKIQKIALPYIEKYEREEVSKFNDTFVQTYAELGFEVLSLLTRFQILSTGHLTHKNIEKTENKTLKMMLQILSDLREELNPGIEKMDECGKMNYFSYGYRVLNVLQGREPREMISFENKLVEKIWELYQNHDDIVKIGEKEEYDLIKEFGKEVYNLLVNANYMTKIGTLQKYHLFSQSDLLKQLITGLAKEDINDEIGWGESAIEILERIDKETGKTEKDVMDKIKVNAKPILSICNKENVRKVSEENESMFTDFGVEVAHYLSEYGFINDEYVPNEKAENMKDENLQKILTSLLDIRKEYNGPLEQSSEKCEGFSYYYLGGDVIKILLDMEHQEYVEKMKKTILTIGNVHVPIERLAEEVKLIHYDDEENITVVTEEVMTRILFGDLYEHEIVYMDSEVMQKYIKKEISLDEIDSLKYTDEGKEKLIALIGSNMPRFFNGVIDILFDMAKEPYGVVKVVIDGVVYYFMDNFFETYLLED